ncbi:MAG: hypothetical protein ABI824_08775 [Acidobacteriota bacterium]
MSSRISSKPLSAVALIACGAVLLSGAPQDPAANSGSGPAAKKPGVKRICAFTSGTGGDAARGPIVNMLTSDLGILDAVALTQRVDVLRQAEIKKDDCDFVFEAEFETKTAKPGGGILSRASKVAGTVNSQAGSLGASSAPQANIGNANNSASNLSRDLAPDPKDKVRIAFKLYSASNSKSPLLTREKEVLAADLQKYIETMINDVANAALK